MRIYPTAHRNALGNARLASGRGQTPEFVHADRRPRLMDNQTHEIRQTDRHHGGARRIELLQCGVESDSSHNPKNLRPLSECRYTRLPFRIPRHSNCSTCCSQTLTFLTTAKRRNVASSKEGRLRS